MTGTQNAPPSDYFYLITDRLLLASDVNQH